MSNLLKDMYNRQSLTKLALDVCAVYSAFDVDKFIESTLDKNWENLELKARGRQVCLNLGKYLPEDFDAAIGIIDKIIANHDGFFGTVFNDFVEVFGQDEENWDISINAMERYTRHASAEFAVRPFIIKHEKRMMAQMLAWSKHEDEHVRRLASEGCRPALPWAQSLPAFKKDPTPILPILEQLKTDLSLYVRKSVANNLNDISKASPDLVVKIAKEWFGKNECTDWIVKHGCRTLLKKANREVLEIFGYGSADSVEVADLILDVKKCRIGEEIAFSFSIFAKTAAKVRLEYGIDYVKSGGKRNRKIFKISEVSLKENERKAYTRKHSFEDLSTRKHYPSTHSITLIVNGAEQGTLDFELI